MSYPSTVDEPRGLAPIVLRDTGDEPATPGCLTVEVDEAGVCVVRLRGALGRDAISRLEIVLDAVGSMARPIVVDLARARTRNRRLLRVLADVAARRRLGDRDTVLRGVHPGVAPDLEEASLPEAFLVYVAVCRPGHRVGVDHATPAGDGRRCSVATHPDRDLQSDRTRGDG